MILTCFSLEIIHWPVMMGKSCGTLGVIMRSISRRYLMRAESLRSGTECCATRRVHEIDVRLTCGRGAEETR